MLLSTEVLVVAIQDGEVGSLHGSSQLVTIRAVAHKGSY